MWLGRRGREVDLLVLGAEIELDRAILDALGEPLLHVLRNAIDHGIEDAEGRQASQKPPRGQVRVTVRRTRDRVMIEVADDGRGMDVEALRASAVARGALSAEAAARLPRSDVLFLACLPGVSTAKDVSELSGRGVGMDAVKRAVERVGGTLQLESEPGRGTCVTFRLPLTVAVLQLLLVKAGGEVLGLPITKVLGVLEAQVAESSGAQLLHHDGASLPVHGLATLLGFQETTTPRIRPYVVMEADRGPVALAVDVLLGQEEVVLKALSRPLDQLPGWPASPFSAAGAHSSFSTCPGSFCDAPLALDGDAARRAVRAGQRGRGTRRDVAFSASRRPAGGLSGP